VDGFRHNLDSLGLLHSINHIGSMFSLFFTNSDVVNFDSAKTSNTAMFGKYFQKMLEKGVYLAPSQYETLFISTAITEQLADKIIAANKEALQEIHS
jgi:glutamate-1-semialdehyde 2,1-aminomutase